MTLVAPLQGPQPPPPFDPNLIFMNEGGPPVILFIVIAAIVATVILLRPLIRALARRMEGKGTADAALRAEVDQLQAKLSEMDALHERIADLEERLDFTERLLAQSHEAQSRLLPGEPR